MKRVFGLFVILVIFALSGTALAAKGGNGQGAGGVRTEKASETGLEKGKAWAGSKEKKSKEGEEAESEDADGEEKVKKEKKDKKDKKDK